jgi:hypothetical protein
VPERRPGGRFFALFPNHHNALAKSAPGPSGLWAVLRRPGRAARVAAIGPLRLWLFKDLAKDWAANTISGLTSPTAGADC